LAKRRLIDRILGSGERQRERRRRAALSAASWTFVGTVVLLVLLLLGQFVSRTMLSHPVSGELNRPDMLVRKGERIQINVLNGSGRSHVAQRFTDYLRARKFDVVHMDNYKDTNVARTFIIDRLGDTNSARKIAYALGVDEKLVRTEVDTEEYVEADLVIGKDFLAMKPMK
jgi:hypothetical protein